MGDLRELGQLTLAFRYHPDDVDPKKFKEQMRAMQDQSFSSGKAAARRALETKYLELKQQFKPVLRHFFREQRSSSMAWFLMRLNYARSLAVTSIAGHLLGLGDRHCSNILIDRVNGELVHIDLGIAFDQVSETGRAV